MTGKRAPGLNEGKAAAAAAAAVAPSVFPPSSAESAFLGWLDKRGATHACEFAVTQCGRGVVASRDLQWGEVAVEIPDDVRAPLRTSCLSYSLRDVTNSRVFHCFFIGTQGGGKVVDPM